MVGNRERGTFWNLAATVLITSTYYPDPIRIHTFAAADSLGERCSRRLTSGKSLFVAGFEQECERIYGAHRYGRKRSASWNVKNSPVSLLSKGFKGTPVRNHGSWLRWVP